MKSGADEGAVEFLNLRFAQMDETGALGWVLDRAKQTDFSYVVTPNVDHIVQIHREAATLDPVYQDAHLRLCDSRVLALIGRSNGLDLSVVTGSGLTARLLSKPLPEGTRVAMVGGNERQRAWLAERQPGAEIHYHEAPMGFRTNFEAQVEAAIFVEETRADIVLITVGAPQSEQLANLIHKRGQSRGVAVCVGASLEFITGEKRRAPVWMQRHCLEWAFRLMSEPRRLARRYLVDGPQVFAIWLRWTMDQRKKQDQVAIATSGPWGIADTSLNDNVVEAPAPLFAEPSVAEVSLAAIQGPGLAAGGGIGKLH